jgi:hypothetical protein
MTGGETGLRVVLSNDRAFISLGRSYSWWLGLIFQMNERESAGYGSAVARIPTRATREL